MFENERQERRARIVEVARRIEECCKEVRNLVKAFMPDERLERECCKYTGVLLTMASGTLCEVYEQTKKDTFDIASVNGVLRKWGLEELDEHQPEE